MVQLIEACQARFFNNAHRIDDGIDVLQMRQPVVTIGGVFKIQSKDFKCWKLPQRLRVPTTDSDLMVFG